MSSGFEGLQSLFNPREGSFLQPQTNFLQTTPYPEQVYVNPINIKSSSLDICNESLGNESGSSIDTNLGEYSYLMSENKNTSKVQKMRKYSKKNGVFPPPLSSMNGVKVEARREGGRLIITASNFCGIHFKSERENGRLRLFLVKKFIDEKVEKDGERVGSKREVGDQFSRCNGDGRGSKKIPSLPLCVTFS